MPYKTKARRNDAERRRRAAYNIKNPKIPIDKTFLSWVRIPERSIVEHDDGVYTFDLVIGPQTLPLTRYNSENGQWHSTSYRTKHAKKPQFKPAWYVAALRPLIIETIERVFDVELPKFGKSANDGAMSASMRKETKRGYAAWVEDSDPMVTWKFSRSKSRQAIERELLSEDAPPQFVTRWLKENEKLFAN